MLCKILLNECSEVRKSMMMKIGGKGFLISKLCSMSLFYGVVVIVIIKKFILPSLSTIILSARNDRSSKLYPSLGNTILNSYKFKQEMFPTHMIIFLFTSLLSSNPIVC